MTIRGALSDLDNLLKADDIPFYYKPSIKAVMDTIALSSSEKPNNSTTKNDLGGDTPENNVGNMDCISRAQTQTEIEMNASRYTIARERGGMGQVEWSDQLIKVSDAVDIIKNLPPVTPQYIDYKAQYERLSQKAEIVISQLRADRDRLLSLSSVTPQEPRCKECKWWKDSDGEYRRGVGAESQCPINRREVYEGSGYCFLYEPQESEDKE